MPEISSKMSGEVRNDKYYYVFRASFDHTCRKLSKTVASVMTLEQNQTAQVYLESFFFLPVFSANHFLPWPFPSSAVHSQVTAFLSVLRRLEDN